MSFLYRPFFILCCCVLFLASCSQLVKLPEQHDWRVAGKLSLKTATEREQSRFVWAQYPGELWHLKLLSSLGNTVLDVIGEPGFIQLKTLGEKPLQSGNPEQLLLEHTGMVLPVNHLGFWLQGLPSPHAAIETSQNNEAGQIRQLQQDGWQLDILSRDQLGPKKLRLKKADVVLLLVIKVRD